MLTVKIFTLYPDLFPGPLNIGIYKKAREKKIWDLIVINIREYSKDKHGSVDDTPYGGGSGMLLRPDVVASALDKNVKKDEKIIYLSPQSCPHSVSLHQQPARGWFYLGFLASNRLYDDLDGLLLRHCLHSLH